MAARIVLLGWGGDAIEFASAMDASAFVSGGTLRVSLAKWAGPLADATVLMAPQETPQNRQAYERLFVGVLRMSPTATRFRVETPIPLAS